jgi:hypothetical protein
MSKVLRSFEDNISTELLKVTYHVWFKKQVYPFVSNILYTRKKNYVIPYRQYLF